MRQKIAVNNPHHQNTISLFSAANHIIYLPLESIMYDQYGYTASHRLDDQRLGLVNLGPNRGVSGRRFTVLVLRMRAGKMSGYAVALHTTCTAVYL